MPELSGAELAKQILFADPTTPIILYTGHSNEFKEKEALRMGKLEFLQKPIDQATLFKVVQIHARLEPL